MESHSGHNSFLINGIWTKLQGKSSLKLCFHLESIFLLHLEKGTRIVANAHVKIARTQASTYFKFQLFCLCKIE